MKRQPTAGFPNEAEIIAWYHKQEFKSSGKIEDYVTQTPAVDTHDMETVILSEGSIIDVRSPHEYQLDHVPGATNIPVLDNLERHIVGSLYKRKNAQAATQVAHSFFEKKEASFMHAVTQLPAPYYFYCWRGGGRSKFVTSHLQSKGYPSFRLKGGYKSYRSRVSDFYESLIEQPPSLLVLAGLTGSGKTRLLEAMQPIWPTLHLEEAAQHCGSVFGHIPYKQAPNVTTIPQAQFESVIFAALRKGAQNEQPILVEDEGRRIGRNHLPGPLYQVLRQSPRIWLELPLEVRIQNIINEYFAFDNAAQIETLMMTALQRLHKFVGAEARRNLQQSLQRGDYDNFVRYLLTTHYDARYRSHPPNIIHTIKANTIEQAQKLLKEWLSERPHPSSYKPLASL